MKTRPAYFAKQGWYPAEPEACRRLVASYLETGAKSEHAQVAAIVPHAGWTYSGATAGRALATLAHVRAERVILFGGHMRPGDKPRCMCEGAFETPLGDILVDVHIAEPFC